MRATQTFETRLLVALFMFVLLTLCMSVAITPVAAITNETFVHRHWKVGASIVTIAALMRDESINMSSMCYLGCRWTTW